MTAAGSLKGFRLIAAVALATLGAGCSLDTVPKGLAVLAIVSGTQQNIQVGKAGAPLVVKAFDVNGLGMEGVKVDWTIPANSGTISSTRTTTDDTGQTSVDYTAPSNAGQVQVRATAENISVTFNLIISPAT